MWNPDPPKPGQNLTITYDARNGILPAAATQMNLRIGYNGWRSTMVLPMSVDENCVWSVTYSVPADANQVNFVFFAIDLDDHFVGARLHQSAAPATTTTAEEAHEVAAG